MSSHAARMQADWGSSRGQESPQAVGKAGSRRGLALTPAPRHAEEQDCRLSESSTLLKLLGHSCKTGLKAPVQKRKGREDAERAQGKKSLRQTWASHGVRVSVLCPAMGRKCYSEPKAQAGGQESDAPPLRSSPKDLRFVPSINPLGLEWVDGCGVYSHEENMLGPGERGVCNSQT